ncbi:hypothetical protein TNCV_21291 [Trichonephila clavipes]|nr:hypothetical protein TNCV_21291 [Trichonephila clavipes]
MKAVSVLEHFSDHGSIHQKMKKNTTSVRSYPNSAGDAPVPTSSEMENIMKSTRSYLDSYSNGEMNNKMDDIEQFVDDLKR